MADKWRDSDQRKSVEEQVREYKENLPLRNAGQPVGLDSKVSLREFAAPFSEQLLIVAKRCFQHTFSHLVVAGIEHAATAIHIAQLLFYLVLIFCGVLVAPAALPGFWCFMYRTSPLTYIVSGLVSTVLGGGARVVECADVETLTVVKPPDVGNTTCAQYLAAYQSYAGGSVLNPDEMSGPCRFCPLASVDAYMESVDIRYSKRWQDFGLVFAYIAFNVCATFALYWLLRVPKRQKLVEKPHTDDGTSARVDEKRDITR
ncbi:Multidrug resistance protein [Botryosphaeria dothidea]